MRPEPSFARSLVAYGNASLRGELPLAAFDGYALTRGWTSSLTFVDGSTTWRSAADWLGHFEKGAQLQWVPRCIPGLEELVVAQTLWLHRWDRNASKVAPYFDASFTRQAGSKTVAAAPAVADVLARLDATLKGLVELSTRADLGNWGKHFARVLAVARGEVAGEGLNPLPPSAPADAVRLAYAGGLADVFGGMGSWNDFAPLRDGDAENVRSRLSSELYTLVEQALLATTK